MSHSRNPIAACEAEVSWAKPRSPSKKEAAKGTEKEAGKGNCVEKEDIKTIAGIHKTRLLRLVSEVVQVAPEVF